MSEVAAHAHGYDSGTGQAAIEGNRGQLIRIGGIRTGDKEDGFGAMLTREHRFVTESSIAVEFLAAFGFSLFGDVTEGENDLVADINAAVRVVACGAFAGHREAIACKDNRGLDLRIGRE